MDPELCEEKLSKKTLGFLSKSKHLVSSARVRLRLAHPKPSVLLALLMTSSGWHIWHKKVLR